jgi:hypothetical protein
MPSLTLDGQVREVLVDVEKRRSRDVAFEIELAATSGVPELPAAVDELVGEGNGYPRVAATTSETAGSSRPSGPL